MNEFYDFVPAPNESKQHWKVPFPFQPHGLLMSCWNGVATTGQGAPDGLESSVCIINARSRHYFPHVYVCVLSEHRLLAKARQGRHMHTYTLLLHEETRRAHIANIKFKSNFLWCDVNREAADCFMYVLSREREMYFATAARQWPTTLLLAFLSLSLCTRGTHTGELYRVRFTTFMGER